MNTFQELNLSEVYYINGGANWFDFGVSLGVLAVCTAVYVGVAVATGGSSLGPLAKPYALAVGACATGMVAAYLS